MIRYTFHVDSVLPGESLDLPGTATVRYVDTDMQRVWVCWTTIEHVEDPPEGELALEATDD